MGARLTPPATAARVPDAVRPAPRASGWIGPWAVEPGLVTVPREPVLRGLPDNDATRRLDPVVFGDHWKLLGWAERGVVGLKQWVAVYEQCFLVAGGSDYPILYDTPELAARTAMKAHLAQV